MAKFNPRREGYLGLDRVTNLSGPSHLSRKSDQIKIRDYMDRPGSSSGYLTKTGAPHLKSVNTQVQASLYK